MRTLYLCPPLLPPEIRTLKITCRYLSLHYFCLSTAFTDLSRRDKPITFDLHSPLYVISTYTTLAEGERKFPRGPNYKLRGCEYTVPETCYHQISLQQRRRGEEEGRRERERERDLIPIFFRCRQHS